MCNGGGDPVKLWQHVLIHTNHSEGGVFGRFGVGVRGVIVVSRRGGGGRRIHPDAIHSTSAAFVPSYTYLHCPYLLYYGVAT